MKGDEYLPSDLARVLVGAGFDCSDRILVCDVTPFAFRRFRLDSNIGKGVVAHPVRKPLARPMKYLPCVIHLMLHGCI